MTDKPKRKAQELATHLDALAQVTADGGFYREVAAELRRLDGLINSAETEDFIEGVRLEAAHQVERWGASDRQNKDHAAWFWLVGYLGGKALRAAITGDYEKARHHTISTAAALAHWHSFTKQEESK